MHRGASELGDHDVRRLLDDQLAAADAEDRERDLVCHRGRRQIDGFRLTEERRGTLLEREHRRVLAALLVANLGASHRLAHRRRRIRLRIGAKIDHAPRLNETLAHRG